MRDPSTLIFDFYVFFKFLWSQGPLPAPTLLHHHVLVLFVHHVVAWVYVQDADGAEFGGDAAAGWGAIRVHRVHERLYDSVVCGLKVRPEREVAHPLAVVRLVIQGRDDPVVPAQLFEIHMQRLFAAPGFGLFPVPLPVSVTQRRPPPPPWSLSFHPPQWHPLLRRLHHQRLLLVSHRPPRLDLLLHLVEEILALLWARVSHQDGFLPLGPSTPVQTQLPQVHFSVWFTKSDAELEAELVPLLVVMMVMGLMLMMLVCFEHFPHVQNLPACLGGVQRVQRPGVQQPVGATRVKLEVVQTRGLQGTLQIPARSPKYP